jgi:Arc/MetJ family transcription regulator
MCIVMCMASAARSTRTNILLDEELIAEATRLTGISTRRGLVHEALRSLIAQRRRRPLSELRGKIEFAPGYDYKASRSARR